MGGVRNIPRGVSKPLRGSGVPAARVSKKGTADKLRGARIGKSKIRASSTRKSRLQEESLVIESFDSAWETLGFAPQEAANLNARADLMIQIIKIIRDDKWTQAAAAKRCGVSQPRINDLLRGKIDKFSIDALVNMATALGRRVNFELLAA